MKWSKSIGGKDYELVNYTCKSTKIKHGKILRLPIERVDNKRGLGLALLQFSQSSFELLDCKT